MVDIRIKAIKIICIIPVCLVVVMAFIADKNFMIDMASKIALYSAKSYLYSFNLDYEEEKTSVTLQEKETETTVPPSEDKKITVKPVVKKTSNENVRPLNSVDNDIADIIKIAEKNSKNDKKDGDIIEYTFTDDGVTDSFENVRVKNTNKTQIDIEEKLDEELELSVKKDKPAVLIYHTHTTETYQLLDRDFYAQGFLSRSDNENLNMIRVGKAIAEEIEKCGFKVIHDMNVYDKTYSGAYYRSEDAARAYLEKYPSIMITLDIHRDAIQDDSGVKTKPVAVIDGKKAAQIMIITGCQEEGNGIEDLPEWEKNLTFALKLQQSMETLYPGLTRPVFFCARSYNMGLTPFSLLVEMGSDANTLDEAVYSGKMLARALTEILKEYKE